MNALAAVTLERGAQRADAASLDAARLARAKYAFTTRRVPAGAATKLVTGGVTPMPGDLVLARVMQIGQHKVLQSVSGRRQNLFVGDEIVAVFGHRYAPDQYEALVPAALGPCQLVAGGGVVASVRHLHARIGRPTELLPLGLLADAQGAVINISRYRLRARPAGAAPRARVIAVLGTSMNAGKTTVAANLIRGLCAAQLKVGAAKVTGTGAGGDGFLFADAGAGPVFDFIDFGYASTYRLPPEELEHLLAQTLRHLDDARVDIAVVEIADGLLQAETSTLVQQSGFRTLVDGIVFAAADSMGAAAGVEWLERRGLPVLALGGLVTTSPLAAREAHQSTHLPVLTSEDLADGPRACALLAELELRCTPRESLS
jgi:hypothetical protein